MLPGFENIPTKEHNPKSTVWEPLYYIYFESGWPYDEEFGEWVVQEVGIGGAISMCYDDLANEMPLLFTSLADAYRASQKYCAFLPSVEIREYMGKDYYRGLFETA